MATENQDDEKSDVLNRAKKRFELASEADQDIRDQARDDYKFRSGDQWPDDVKFQRTLQKRPCLTINQLPMFLRQIINDQRQNRPSIKINAVSDDASVETAQVIEGLVRHIEYSSNAEIAYDTASDGQCTGGFGYFRVITKYCDPMSFDQDIKIARIKDPFAVRLDPSYQEPDGSDANWGFVYEDVSKDWFKEHFPDAELSQMDGWETIGDSVPGWVIKDGCRIAEYYERTSEKQTIYLTSDGQVFTDETLPGELPSGIEVIEERESKKHVVTWYKTNGYEILEETEWPGSFIPIIPVLGDEILIDGKRILEGVIRHAKDSQRMYNYWATASTEMIALAPKAPYIGAAGQFEGFEQQWKTANVENHSYLQYNQVDIEGKPAPPPQRQQYEAPTQAINQERQMAAADLRSTTGIQDAMLGQRSNEQSGLAVQRRSQQSQLTNFHLSDNFTRSLKHAGRIILELIPKIYDAARTVRIIHEDGSQEMVAINQALGLDQNGQSTGHFFDVGKYDVTVSTGPSYQTKRQEFVADALELTKNLPPQQAAVITPVMVKNMDWPMAKEMGERLEMTLPPQFQTQKGQEPLPPQAQAQISQMQLVMAQLQGKLAAAEKIIQTKMIETSAKERIENMRVKADIEKTLAEMGASSAETLLEHQINQIDRQQDQLQQQQNLTGGASPGTSTGAQSPGNQGQSQWQ